MRPGDAPRALFPGEDSYINTRGRAIGYRWRLWSRGMMEASHAFDPGSSPGGRISKCHAKLSVWEPRYSFLFFHPRPLSFCVGYAEILFCCPGHSFGSAGTCRS